MYNLDNEQFRVLLVNGDDEKLRQNTFFGWFSKLHSLQRPARMLHLIRSSVKRRFLALPFPAKTSFQFVVRHAQQNGPIRSARIIIIPWRDKSASVESSFLTFNLD